MKQTSIKNKPKIGQTSIQNRFKYQPRINLKLKESAPEPLSSTTNRPGIDPNSVVEPTTNRPGIDPKSVPEPISLLRPVLDRFWFHFGPNLGPPWGSKTVHVGRKIDFWRLKKAIKSHNDFQHPSRPPWDRFWDDFGIRKRTQIDAESDSRAIKRQGRASSISSRILNEIENAGDSRSMKNWSKSHLR